MGTLRLSHHLQADGHRVDMVLAGTDVSMAASVRFEFTFGDQDREELRWYLEDYLVSPGEPASVLAARVEGRLIALGTELFSKVFGGSDARVLWAAVAAKLPDTRVEIASAGPASAIPWELLCDPATEALVALRAAAFVRVVSMPSVPAPVTSRDAQRPIRVLLVICRPGRTLDAPFRSAASHLLRLSSAAREAFKLDVLRPPTFAALHRTLESARRDGNPYDVVHFDGHGIYADAAGPAGLPRTVSPARPGPHGYLVFEEPSAPSNQSLVDGPAFARLLVDTAVPVLVLNAAGLAHAEPMSQPARLSPEAGDTAGRDRAYDSLAQEAADAGVAGIVALGYSLPVITVAGFVGDLYAALAEGRDLGRAVGTARRRLEVPPAGEGVLASPRHLQGWTAPVAYESAPLVLRAAPVDRSLRITLSQEEAGTERARLDPALPADPDSGFYGRDETLLALDRAFDTNQAVLLHAPAGAGKTSTAVEFARWYALTGGIQVVLFTSFAHHLPLARVLDQVGTTFGPALEAAGVQWLALNATDQRSVALQVFAQIPVLWIWDDVGEVAGPPGALPAWSTEEQKELAQFVRDLGTTRAKLLLTARNDDLAWLGELPARISLPPMPMLEQVQLAQAIAAKRHRPLTDAEYWQPLLEFARGNPLSVALLVGQALREGLRNREQVEGFVARLREGEAHEDVAQREPQSLDAALGYGVEQAFTPKERVQLALLHLFQGFVDVDALCEMGDTTADYRVPEIGGISRETAVALLDRAVELGLLSGYGRGYYAIHPALPWYFQALFAEFYGAPEQAPATRATRAYVEAIAVRAAYYRRRYDEGRAEILDALAAEEANLINARQLAVDHEWWAPVIKLLQGLYVLYAQTGRTTDWTRAIQELVPHVTAPGTDGPLPGREEQWGVVTEYRVQLARQSRDLVTAERLQRALVTWNQARTAGLEPASRGPLEPRQRNLVLSLALSEEALGHVLREQDRPDCLTFYHDAAAIFRRLGDRDREAEVAYSLGKAYLDIVGLRDLDSAQRWYHVSLDLLPPGDGLRRARSVEQLGRLAFERFLEGRRANSPAEAQREQLGSALAEYQRALDLLPASDVRDLAKVHNDLGVVYQSSGDADQAVRHYQQAVRYSQYSDDRYSAGLARSNIAAALTGTQRPDEALGWARAALDDLQRSGPGAVEAVNQTQRLITQIEQIVASSQGEGS